ncbi:MAG TPA: ATP-binding protein [Thioalkalivibrio sp.]|nr:ATP-binding protein [Thioalkalivibrio sp.]
MANLETLIERGERLLARLEHWTGDVSEPDWSALAFQWRQDAGPWPVGGRGHLFPIRHPQPVTLDDLLNLDRQKQALVQNTRQFLAGLPANNALLSGARGTGKSSLVKALLTAFATEGLRMVEVDKAHLVELPMIVAPLRDRPERFLVYTDDLSSEAGDPAYKALKAILDGSLQAPPDNVLIYATSNRRHLMPEFMAENDAARVIEGELHPGEAIEEKVSLSERFGLWLSFYPFTQEEYLAVVRHWIERLDERGEALAALDEKAAMQFATQRGSRSGRVARQFAVDWVGRRGLDRG